MVSPVRTGRGPCGSGVGSGVGRGVGCRSRAGCRIRRRLGRGLRGRLGGRLGGGRRVFGRACRWLVRGAVGWLVRRIRCWFGRLLGIWLGLLGRPVGGLRLGAVALRASGRLRSRGRPWICWPWGRLARRPRRRVDVGHRWRCLGATDAHVVDEEGHSRPARVRREAHAQPDPSRHGSPPRTTLDAVQRVGCRVPKRQTRAST